jgi:hypothetical protein
MTTTTAKEFFGRLGTANSMFGATSLRKNDKIVDGEIVARAGEEIRSTYRLNVPATIKEAETRLAAGQRAQEDDKNGVLTVFDMNKDDAHGVRGAFRRINLAGLEEIRVNHKKYESRWNNDLHTWEIIEKDEEPTIREILLDIKISS